MTPRVLRLTPIAAGVAVVIALGTLGYILIEGASPLDAFYMTAITVTTIGFREVFPLSPAGEIFTVALAFLGVGVILYFGTEVAGAMLSADIRRVLGLRRDTKMIDDTKDHIVVCGYGRMGRAIVDVVRSRSAPLVVVEQDADKVSKLEERGICVVHGDATEEPTLRAAGVDRARTFIASLADDAHNVYSILLARQLNGDLTIIARAAADGAEERLRLAGAHRVVNPYRLGGARIAYTALKPAVIDFLDASLSSAGMNLEFAEIRLRDDSELVGSTLAETDVRRRFGVIVVAIRRDDESLFDPTAEQRFEAGDVLVALGPTHALESFGEACQ